ncbi:HD domain-containing protein [Bacillus sp. Xin]|uniref:HD domain-containing protein n=1 Tax=unclassified Bacillus (in: firmicutes) TaxID=185979 RepID=UPI001572FBF0|nr:MULTISPECIES: HD domain-containing protein [unclassified Bacillus (in: firmicutes)]MBC6972185.1 HD domain-containing protein [Bacillus sp. Xin]NSW36883.1 HD domain-containing protein [Bacillus sp. Xin1]
MTLKLRDALYGEFEVDGVLLELICSEPFQRLKGIYQGGASYLVNANWDNTRYDHSIGTMMLVNKLGGSLEEQVAALLHDVSHTAFSHVIDYVLGHKEENYHETIYEQIVARSSIPNILANAGLDWKSILLDESQWTLLEQPAPQLCADRVDYTLRDLYAYGHITLQEAHFFLEQLVVLDGKMVCSDQSAAEWFVSTYYKEVIGLFMDPLNMFGNDQLAKTLRSALQKDVLSIEDFLKEDEAVIRLLKDSGDSSIEAMLHTLFNSKVEKGTRSCYDVHQTTKQRLMDPLVIVCDQLVPVSNLSTSVKVLTKQAKQTIERGVYIKICSQ